MFELEVETHIGQLTEHNDTSKKGYLKKQLLTHNNTRQRPLNSIPLFKRENQLMLTEKILFYQKPIGKLLEQISIVIKLVRLVAGLTKSI